MLAPMVDQYEKETIVTSVPGGEDHLGSSAEATFERLTAVPTSADTCIESSQD